jgi:hypothetical protein
MVLLANGDAKLSSVRDTRLVDGTAWSSLAEGI